MLLVQEGGEKETEKKGTQRSTGPGFYRRGGGCLEGVAVDVPSSPVT